MRRGQGQGRGGAKSRVEPETRRGQATYSGSSRRLQAGLSRPDCNLQRMSRPVRTSFLVQASEGESGRWPGALDCSIGGLPEPHLWPQSPTLLDPDLMLPGPSVDTPTTPVWETFAINSPLCVP